MYRIPKSLITVSTVLRSHPNVWEVDIKTKVFDILPCISGIRNHITKLFVMFIDCSSKILAIVTCINFLLVDVGICIVHTVQDHIRTNHILSKCKLDTKELERFFSIRIAVWRSARSLNLIRRTGMPRHSRNTCSCRRVKRHSSIINI